ncbi:MAG: hypothetical protein IJ326_06465 [Lachnospiraceae bacterium]|nr:hypothetical protein [Lachnospiraceae bacterium]
MAMYSIRRFVQAECLLIMLGLLGIRTTSNVLLCLILTGMLMILFTIKSLEKEISSGFLFIQYLLSGLLCIATADFLSFLIFSAFYVEEGKKIKYAGVWLPSALYVVTAICANAVGLWHVEVPWIVLHALVLLLIVAFVWGTEYLIKRYITTEGQNRDVLRVAAINELVDKKLRKELIVKNYLREKNARLEERETISRNIHNSVGHSITAAIMTLDAADMLYDTAPEKARERMNTANARMREGLAAVRHAVRVLDEENVYLTVGDLIRNFTTVVEQFTMDTMIRVSTDWETVPKTIDISREHTEFLSGALQELLTNGVKHGEADRFVVRLTADSCHVRLWVNDNGKNDFSKVNQKERIAKGFGLKKLDSYVQHCGGSLMISAGENGQGFGVELTLPLEKERDDEAVSDFVGR